MKFLADVNIEKPIVDELKRMGHDIKWVPEVDCHLDDVGVLRLANKEDRILLTNDKDFGEIVFRQRLIVAGVVLFRVKGQDAKEKVSLMRKFLAGHGDKLQGHFAVISREKFRIIPV